MTVPINLIKIIGLQNETINFGNLLANNNSLYFKNCFNIKIITNSKINKITIEKSSNIFISLNKLINGIEVAYSNMIFVSSENSDDPKDSIPSLDIYKTTFYLIGSIDYYTGIKVISSKSDLYQITN